MLFRRMREDVARENAGASFKVQMLCDIEGFGFAECFATILRTSFQGVRRLLEVRCLGWDLPLTCLRLWLLKSLVVIS